MIYRGQFFAGDLNMIDDERTWAVKRILFEYVKSPSLKHIRDPYSITKLAQEIVKRLDRGNVVWTKWTEHLCW